MFVAIVFTWILTSAFAWLIVWLRNRRFRLKESSPQVAKPTDRHIIAAGFGVPTPPSGGTTSAYAEFLQSFSRPLDTLHDSAVKLQNIYHGKVARCVSCLAIAILALGLSLTVFHGNKPMKVFSASVDVAALLLSFWYWWQALSANHRWVATRTKTELLRQAGLIEPLLQPHSTVAPADAAAALFTRKARQIDAEVIRPGPKSWLDQVRDLFRHKEALDDRTSEYWGAERQRLAAATNAAQLDPQDLVLYLRRRPVRQLAWFRLAQQRLHGSGRRRAMLLAGLYGLAAGLAGLKAAMTNSRQVAADAITASAIEPSVAADLVAFVLLATTVLSATLTALYLSRNDRSLMHRYATQERRIEDWLRAVTTFGAAAVTLKAASPAQFGPDVLKFEDIMVEELIDWIRISTHDTIELAP